MVYLTTSTSGINTPCVAMSGIERAICATRLDDPFARVLRMLVLRLNEVANR